MRAKVIAIFIIVLLGYFSLYAQAPQLLNYQGKLTNKDGTAASGDYTMVFKIYPDSTGGKFMWDEFQTIKVTNGIFNVLLGSVRPFPDTLFTTAGNRYLGIQVGTDPEMKPRFQLTSVPFAFQAIYPKIQGGVWGAGDIPYKGVPEWREKTQVISLTGFSKPPTVISFFKSIDANSAVAFLRIATDVRNIKKDEFTLVVGTYADTHIYGVTVSWIAFGF